MSKHVYTMRGPVATLNEAALNLETVPRNPDGVIDRAIINIRALVRHIGVNHDRSVYPIEQLESYCEALRETADTIEATSLDTDTPGGVIANTIKDLRATAYYIAKIEPEKAIDAMQVPKAVESVQIPPSMQGEPADALDKPAGVVPPADKLQAFLESEAQPSELFDAEPIKQGVPFDLGKKDASKGEGIVQACAQIRGEIASNIPSVDRVLEQVRLIEDAAFSKATPTFALNANGKPLDAEQVRLIVEIKDAQARLLALGAEVQEYLVAKQQRLRAICDADPVKNYDCEDVLTEAQQQAYGDYKAFSSAAGYQWLDRGLGDVQVGVMSLVRAVAGPTS